MFTLGYALNLGLIENLLQMDHQSCYLKETVKENNLEKKIIFSHKVRSASWDSSKSEWTLKSLIMLMKR